MNVDSRGPTLLGLFLASFSEVLDKRRGLGLLGPRDLIWAPGVQGSAPGVSLSATLRRHQTFPTPEPGRMKMIL